MRYEVRSRRTSRDGVGALGVGSIVMMAATLDIVIGLGGNVPL